MPVTTATERLTNPIVILADKVEPKPYLTAFLHNLRRENRVLPPEQAIKFALCRTSEGIALALRWHRENIRMILIGSGLQGNAWTVARMLCKRIGVALVVDAKTLGNPLYHRIKDNLESLGVVAVPHDATDAFFKPLTNDFVLSELEFGSELRAMSPEERAEEVEKRLETITKFPSLPETQRRVAVLDDLDPPRLWAEAIDPDVLTRTVILRTLNSAHYGFRSRVEAIDQAVVIASARTIREIVLACQIRQLFERTSDKSIDQFWRHSIAVGFFAKLFTLPPDLRLQTPAQRLEFSRYRLDDQQVRWLQNAQLWQKLKLAPKEDAFACGILHDIGKITMLQCLEDSLEMITSLIAAGVKDDMGQGKLWAQPTTEIERLLMQDIDHQVIGYRLAKRWELDEKTCRVIGFHHDLEERSANLLKLIALADLAANTLFPFPATEAQHPLPRLFERIAGIARKKPARTLAESVYNATEEVYPQLMDVCGRLGIPQWTWRLIDATDFFFFCYQLAPKMRSITISFLQQTAK
jgi:HD-like signal output (HDOD) protein